ncbi:hypothetical protein [Streptomyces sp. NBC_00483]|uniref:hypothetical protein n=1 Tax=Streptomyces sp. NBC_00483 TaxID=2975756 RepID=UPI002E199257
MSDYDDLTNADVMSYAEMEADDRDAELRLDAADEERALTEEQARAAEHHPAEDDGECMAEFIDGSWTDCGCVDCEEREADEAFAE